jgi:hypothetical protein
MADDDNVQGLQVQRSPFYRIIYASVARTRLTPNEVGITFAVLTDTPGSPTVNVILEECHVAMSYTQAKQLVEQLQLSISTFEAEFGEAPTQPLPENAKAVMSKTIEIFKQNGLIPGKR